MTNTEFTESAEWKLARAIDLLRTELAACNAKHDVYERRHGHEDRYAGMAAATAGALYWLGAGSWDEIDAVAESMWPAAMEHRAEMLAGAAAESKEPHIARDLAESAKIARQLLAEHEAAKRAAA